MTAPADGPNAQQAEYWNSDAGRRWIRHEDMLNTLLDSVGALLLRHAGPLAGESVLEIGCGAGATTRALAGRVGAEGRVLAVDISEPLLDQARRRAVGLADDIAQVSFLLADAQVHAFEPASADLAVSRFGVMFFEDPVAAFRNIAAALRPGGRLCFVTWAAVAENPWFLIPRDAAIARVGQPAPQPPTAPGPMAFADRDRVAGLLSEAGLAGVRAEAAAVDLLWPGEIGALATLAASLGPAVRILGERGGGPEDEAAVREAVTAGLQPFGGPDGFRIPAALNVFSAVRA